MNREVSLENFLDELTNQLRAYDIYGIWAKKSNQELVKEFIKNNISKSISLIGHCEIDPKAVMKIYAFYKTVAALIEKETGLITSVVVNLDEEGNGRVIIYTGRLILHSITIRDANNFGFKSVEDIQQKGIKLVNKGTEIADKFREVALV